MKILIIDDSYEFCEPLKEILDSWNHESFFLSESDDALKEIKDLTKYDVIILDIMLIVGDSFKLEKYPEVGVFLYDEIRKKNKKKPIIIVSALTRQQFSNYFLDDENLIYLNKPLSPEYSELLSALNKFSTHA
jgi:DNA-binding response OmpR family regulator